MSLGTRSLEGLNLKVDRSKRPVSAGPCLPPRRSLVPVFSDPPTAVGGQRASKGPQHPGFRPDTVAAGRAGAVGWMATSVPYFAIDGRSDDAGRLHITTSRATSRASRNEAGSASHAAPRPDRRRVLRRAVRDGRARAKRSRKRTWRSRRPKSSRCLATSSATSITWTASSRSSWGSVWRHRGYGGRGARLRSSIRDALLGAIGDALGDESHAGRAERGDEAYTFTASVMKLVGETATAPPPSP